MSERRHIPKPPLFLLSKVVAFVTSAVLYIGLLLIIALLGFSESAPEDGETLVSVSFVEDVPRTLQPDKKSGSDPVLPEEKVEETLPVRPVPERDVTTVDTDDDARISSTDRADAERLLALMREGSAGTGNIGDRSEGGREDGIARHGGSRAAEDAVAAALRWLAAHQDKDGKWSAKGFPRHCPAGNSCGGSAPRPHTGFPDTYDVGVTGLSLLCFLGHGNTHEKGEHRDVVGRGLAYLLSRQNKRTGAFNPGERVSMYNHAIATLCLAEAYAMSRDEALRVPLVKAVAFICQAQQKSGGWDYTQMKSNRNDTSVTGWQVMALKSAKSAGVTIPWRTVYGILKHFERVTDEEGYVGYTNARVSRSNIALAAVGMLSNRYIGRGANNATVKQQERILLQNLPAWHKMKGRSGRDHSMYYWYYGTLAMYQQGGRAWGTWNAAIRDMLVKAQCRTGHQRGSWDPDGHWARTYAGRVYATALMTLTLEIYYRYLPMYESGETLGSGTALVEALRAERNPAAKLDLLNKLVLLNDARLGEVLKTLLADPHPTVRLAAAKHLARRGEAEAIPFLAKGLADEDAFYRFSAIRALEELEHPETIGALIRALSDPIEGNANVAARALQRKAGVRFGFDTTKDPAERRKIIASWESWWKNNRRKFVNLPDVRGAVVRARDGGKRVLIKVTAGAGLTRDMRLMVFRAGNLIGHIRIVAVLPGGMAEGTVIDWRLEGATIRRDDVVGTRKSHGEKDVD